MTQGMPGISLLLCRKGLKMRLLEMRGMPLALLIDLVHRNGGVLGPAHPCGEKYMSFTNARRYYLSPEIVKRFDFVEALIAVSRFVEFRCGKTGEKIWKSYDWRK